MSNLAILSPTPTECPEGFIGNLNEEHQAKLRQMWSCIFKVYDMYDSKDPELQEAIKNSHKAATAAPKASRFSLFGGKKSGEDASSNAIIEKHLNLSAEGSGEEDKFGLRKQFMAMLAQHTSESIRSMILECIKCDHPDALVLRFLRARKWEIDRALIMMFSAMDWRYNKSKVDSDIMKNGEAQAVADEKNNDIAYDFMRQIRPGKGFLHGTDRLGRPISYVRVRLHKPLAQKVEALERFIIYQIETGRLALEAPVETACLVFDMTGFTLANMDYVPVKFIIQSFEANYPESLGAILLHNSPWVFKGIWRIIHPWLDPVVASKVHFTYGREGLEEFIEPSHIIKELGGDEDWEYKYDEPVEGENDRMKDTATRDTILKERRELADKFEAATRRWIANPEDEEAEKVKAERNDLAKKLRENYWVLDPYVRARGLFDRQGNLRGGDHVTWYPEEQAAADAKAKGETAAPAAAPAAGEAAKDDDAAAATQAVEDLKLSGNPEKEANVTATSNAVAAA